MLIRSNEQSNNHFNIWYYDYQVWKHVKQSWSVTLSKSCLIIRGKHCVLCEVLTSALWLLSLVSLEFKLRDKLNLRLGLEMRSSKNLDQWHLEISFTSYFAQEVPKCFTIKGQNTSSSHYLENYHFAIICLEVKCPGWGDEAVSLAHHVFPETPHQSQWVQEMDPGHHCQQLPTKTNKQWFQRAHWWNSSRTDDLKTVNM